MGNNYGQIESHVEHQGKSGVGEAADLLFAEFVKEAYGILDHAPSEAPVAIVDGVQVAQKCSQNPQHQLSTDGLTIHNPAFYAEMKAQEKAMWKLLRRGYARLCDLQAGKCLRCRNENDQPRRRFCSKCEAKAS